MANRGVYGRCLDRYADVGMSTRRERGVPAQVALPEGGYEEVGVVISLPPSQRQTDPGLRAGGLRTLRLELALQEPVLDQRA
jgi:hypothetical protein